MGNARSRPQRRPEDETPTTQTSSAGASSQPQRPSTSGSYAQYPAPNVYNRQQTPYPHPHPSNGQYYGGWNQPHHVPPPYGPPRPIPPPHPHHHPSMRPYPHVPTPPPPPPAPTTELTQTATIRNAVNLKKPSLKLIPSPDNPSKLIISFSFDASAACAVSTFVAATEEPSAGCRLVPALQFPAPTVIYPKGLGHKFPKPQDDNADENQHTVELELYDEDRSLLHTTVGDRYPLVIRLEVITEKGIKAGHTLEELIPGAEQKPWVQSQTTFAAMRREEDGSYSVSVIKQKIWVEGVSYELQEIYGLEQAAGKKTATEVSVEDAEERLCVICLVNPRDTTVLPCRHMCMCYECAQELRKQSSKCPICRNHVESLLHIKMNKGTGGSAAKKGLSGGTSNSKSSEDGVGSSGQQQPQAVSAEA